MNTVLALLSFALALLSCDDAQTRHARIITTQASLKAMVSAVVDFKKALGRLPTEQEGIEALVRRPADWPDEVPWAPFLETTKIPGDGWGNAFVYVLTAESPQGFGIYSCGADGVTSSRGNDQDDINTWNTASPWSTYYRHLAEKEEMQSAIVVLAISVLFAAATGGFLWRETRTEAPSEP